ncbi:hypothetical protein PTKIN_Ptkin09bG0023500 [Pterospermum kingtungense]
MSSSTTSVQDSFTVSYLINKLGFSPESALAVSKYLVLKTPDNADSVISFLEIIAFSEYQIKTLIKKKPGLLASKVDKTLVPKLEFLKSKGFSGSDLARLLCQNPSVLGASLEKQLVPFFNSFTNLTHSGEKTIKAITCYSFIFSYDIDAYILPNVNILRDHGVPESNIILSLYRFPCTFVISPVVFKEIVDEVIGMGFNCLIMKFIYVVSMLRHNNKCRQERKFGIFKKWGWSDQEILNAFRKDPHVIRPTEEKIAGIMDFLVNRMGVRSVLVANQPSVLGRSLEKRIVPRGLYAQDLLSKGLIDSIRLSPLFDTSEKAFLQRFVYHYGEDKAPELLKMYKYQVERAAAGGGGGKWRQHSIS